MRTSFRFLVALAAGVGLLAAAPAQAQTLTNLNLETWSQRAKAVPTGVEAPTNWQTTDDLLSILAKSPLPSSTATVSKTTDVHGGSFAAKMESKVYAPFQSIIPVVPGILTLGNAIKFTSDGSEITGVPYTGRPTSVQFYYKLTGPAALNDSAAVFFSLTRNVGGTTQYVVSRGVLLAPAAAYTLVTLPLTYTSTTTPDSLHLTFTSGDARRPTAGTALFIDDVAVVGTATATHAAAAAAISVSPNPSPDGRYVLSTTEAGLLAAPLTVLDATGRVVRREDAPRLAAAASRTLDLSALPGGIYTVQLFTPRGLVTRKLTR